VTEIFISYAREDSSFVEALAAALEERGISAWVDRQDIAPSTEWLPEIDHGIECAEALLTVVTPDSAESEMCRHEVGRAAELGKRILPVVRREPGSGATIDAIAVRNWIFWRDDGESASAIDQIEEALQVDPEWAKEHTRLLGRALEWDRHSRDRHRLLRGSNLDSAEAAIALDRPVGQPQATEMQREYVQESRVSATRRQRRAVAIAVSVAAVSITLAVIAGIQFVRADTERQRAEEQLRIARSRTLAAQAVEQTELEDRETGLLLAAQAATVDPTVEARDALLTVLATDSAALASLRSPEEPDAAVTVVASPDGRFEVSNDGRTLTDTSTGESQTLVDHPDPLAIFLRDVAISPDSSRLVVTNLKAFEFQVYDLSEGVPAPVLQIALPDENESVGAAAFDSGNRLIGVSDASVAGAPGGVVEGLSVSVWAPDGTQEFSAKVEGALPTDFDLLESLVAMNPDDDIAAIVTQWGEAQLFSPRTAQFIGPPLPAECTPNCGPTDAYDTARFTIATIDGSELSTVDAYGVSRTFDLDLARWISMACQAGGRTLTEQEWGRFVGADVAYEPAC
jgi:hypothetical protein